MDNDKTDLRVTRTRKMLCGALLELMQTKELHNISVMDICEKAMVRRATFYNHFKDKEDLLNYGLDEIQEHLFEKSIKDREYASPKEMYLSLLSNVIDFVSENRDKFCSVLKNNSEKLIISLLNTIRKSFRYLNSKNKSDAVEMPVEFVISFFAGGITLAGVDWLQENRPYSKAQIMEFIENMINEDVFKIK